jgi:hypothetical protein
MIFFPVVSIHQFAFLCGVSQIISIEQNVAAKHIANTTIDSNISIIPIMEIMWSMERVTPWGCLLDQPKL